MTDESKSPKRRTSNLTSVTKYKPTQNAMASQIHKSDSSQKTQNILFPEQKFLIFACTSPRERDNQPDFPGW